MANISLNDYDGKFEITFDCTGVKNCKFRLCEIEPPEPDTKCVRHRYGSCTSEPAQAAAMKRVQRKINNKLKNMIDI